MLLAASMANARLSRECFSEADAKGIHTNRITAAMSLPTRKMLANACCYFRLRDTDIFSTFHRHPLYINVHTILSINGNDYLLAEFPGLDWRRRRSVMRRQGRLFERRQFALYWPRNEAAGRRGIPLLTYFL